MNDADRPADTAIACTGHKDTDLRSEPTYTVNYLRRWKHRDGCPVRLDVLMWREPGSDFHCAPWPTEVVLGPRFEALPGDTTRSYVRRPPDSSWVAADAAQGYAAPAALPRGAIDAGYVTKNTHLWIDPTTDSYVWLVTDDAVERLPKSTPKSCA